MFCLLSRTFANIGFDAFLPMVKYMLGVLLALALQCLVVYMILLSVFARVNPFTFLKKFVSVMAFAFSTATSNATIPLNIETLDKKMGVDRRISSFTIPLGATINMDGTAIMQGVAVVFTAQLFGVDLGPIEYATVIATATLASIGTAGVPSVGLITLSMVFNSVRLPLEGIALIMGIDRILDMTRTAVNITGDAVCTMVVAKQEGRVNKAVLEQIPTRARCSRRCALLPRRSPRFRPASHADANSYPRPTLVRPACLSNPPVTANGRIFVLKTSRTLRIARRSLPRAVFPLFQKTALPNQSAKAI